jgi:hypothetical protein
VEIGEGQLDKDNFPEVEDMVSVCAGLVTVDNKRNIIRLVHYTTQEYFERTWDTWHPNAEREATITCIMCLSFNELKSGICEDDEKFKERLQSNRLYDYASHHWTHHAREASMLIPEVISFLETKAQVEASSQVLMAVERWSGSVDSQDIPKKIQSISEIGFSRNTQCFYNNLLD